jgi:Spy/CpxP family protein refolding chaperone
VNDPKIAEELLLSSEQVEALKKMRMDVQTEMITLNADRDKAALKQAELMSAEQPDLEAVLKAVEEVGTLQTKIAKLRVKTLLEAKKVLTPEQLQKAKEMFSERMRERREQMMQQRGDRRRSERPAGPPPNPGPVEPPPIQ